MLLSARADAGRTHFGWMFGTEINPRRSVELENWIIDINHLDKPDGIEVHETQVWLGFVFALDEHFQLAVNTETEYADDHVEKPSTNLVKFGGDVRWRPQAPDAKGLTTLFRVGVKKLVEDRAGIRTEADVVVAYEHGRIVAAVDVGAREEHLPDEDVLELHPDVGISVHVVDRFRVGAELYGELTVKGDDPSWIVVGPTVSLTSGRLWGAATLGVGLEGVDNAGQIRIGVVL